MIYVGNKGIRFTLTIMENASPVDLTAFAGHDILFVKPDQMRTQVVVPGLFVNDGTDGQLYCESPPDLLNIAGKRWSVRAQLSIDKDHLFFSDPAIFEVDKL